MLRPDESASVPSAPAPAPAAAAPAAAGAAGSGPAAAAAAAVAPDAGDASATDDAARRPPASAPSPTAAGLGFSLAAYTLWGLLPLYFLLLAPAGAVEVVAWRVVLSLVFCVLLVAVARTHRRTLAVLRDRRVVLVLGAASVLIAVNWLTYVLAALSGHVVEAALGYFLNPIVTVLLGVVVLRERLRPAQWAAIGISALAAVVLTVGYGSVPVIALILAFSFGLYGLVKNRTGGRVDAVSGLTIESAWIALPATIALGVIAATDGLAMGAHGAPHTIALLLAGAVTAVPLLLFASAARRLPLTVLGLTQYIAPIMQFIVGVALLGEPMPPERLAGFALVWVALIVLSTDALLAARRTANARRRAASDA